MPYSREQLAAAYVALVGYDPFQDDPSITEREVAEILRDVMIEALEAAP